MKIYLKELASGNVLEAWKFSLEDIEEMKAWIPGEYQVNKATHYFLDDYDSAVRLDEHDYIVKEGDKLHLIPEPALFKYFEIMPKEQNETSVNV